jgi:ATP-dependent helicase YprA (DUF1998 family)
MNFQEFYNKTENRLTDAILSLWATGDKEMQDYFKYLLSREPILADAVFQSTFPWENDSKTLEETTGLFSQQFINALDNIQNDEFRFPRERNPYKHQLKSWQALLQDKKSIAVTTGTGSGKTECFMLPVLEDIHKNCRNQTGINAIFLYPLNALIASQRKRMHAWCSALGGVNYALLTGDTGNTANNEEKNRALPQLISRQQIRETPPQILFTNPTMLEYMLVRNADVPIIEKSQGKLRWILLDEAHTLTGSKAAEMALLIRRVVAAFGTDIKNIRFAITSATVGNGETSVLKKFMAELCGIEMSQIEVITGNRTKDEIKDEELPSLSEILNKKNIQRIREDFLASHALSLKEIGSKLNLNQKQKQLEAIDQLAGSKVNTHNLLPVRGHFFTRGIGGVYVCTNNNCLEHKDIKPNKAIGTMYTIAGKQCSCGFPLLELVACRSCGHMMIEGERTKGKNGYDRIRQRTSEGYEAFHIDQDEAEIQDEESAGISNLVRFIRNSDDVGANQALLPRSISREGEITEGDDFLLADENKCPHCGSRNDNPIHFRISSAFTNRILSDIILEQTQNAIKPTKLTLFNGKKYISFTDSRQGTAKIAALINIDSESDWIRYQLYHYLLRKLKSHTEADDREDLQKKRSNFFNLLDKASPSESVYIREILEKIDEKLKKNNPETTKSSRSSWSEIIDYVKNKKGFHTLFKKAARGNDLTTQNEIYARSLLYDQFSRRLPRERSLENLGLVNLIYPEIDNITLPHSAQRLNISIDEWKDLLKISMDYIIRNRQHFSFDNAIRVFSTKLYIPQLLYPSNAEELDAKKWPLLNENSVVQSKLVLLILAGLGWHEVSDLDEVKIDQVNELLQSMWNTLKSKLLIRDDNGYKLDFYNKTKFELAGKVYLCPVTKRLIDKHFRGYSPWIKGSLTHENIENFKMYDLEGFKFPIFKYPFHLDEENDLVDKEIVREWLKTNSQEARQKGLWNNLHERIYDFEKLYLAGEHSAQQSKLRLQELEDQFETGEINILSCSTTMEMGVDIGGISAVVMSNVPPMPANYLQRTGRAGRRSENKSLALTFCAPNPIGLRTMDKPKWALTHKIAPPKLVFDSKTIVEKHVNSLLFGIFVRQELNSERGLNIKQNIEKFFFSGNPPIAENFITWLENCDVNSVDAALQYLIEKTPFQAVDSEQLIALVLQNFEKVRTKAFLLQNGYETKLKEISLEFGDNSPAYKAINYRKLQFLKKFILGYLAEEGFLPNAGLPTGIIEFEKLSISDLQQNTAHKDNPSYPISRALTEFAPGNDILIDGLNYKSAGIILKNVWGQEIDRNAIQGCRFCGYQRILGLDEKIDDNCPKCNNANAFKGIDLGEHSGTLTELIEPAGFAVDLYSTPSRVVSDRSKPQYLEPLLLNINPWDKKQNNFLDFRTSEGNRQAEILYYNTGAGEGYSVCLECGRVDTEHKKLINHRRLRGGRSENNSDCNGIIRDNIILGSRIKTDFTEIRLKNRDNSFVNDKNLAYSVGVIFTKSLTEHLGIEETEIDFGIKRFNEYQTIFLYDTAKGGAGYSSQFSFYTKEILQNALDVLRNCDCQTACTKCLVDRSSQWHIENLDRHIAIEWLTDAVQNELPLDLQKNREEVKTFFGSLEDEIRRISYHYGIKEINIHINNSNADWVVEENFFLEKLKRNRIKINLIVEGDLSYANQQDKLSVYLLSRDFNLKQGEGHKLLGYPIHLSIHQSDGKVCGYISNTDYNPLTAGWASDLNNDVFKVESYELDSYPSLKLPQFNISNLFESRFSIVPKSSKSNHLAKLVLDNLNSSQEFIEKISDRSYHVSYYDKYNQSEFSLRLMLQFIQQFSNLGNFEVRALKVCLSKKDFERNNRFPYYLIDNYKELDDYKYDLEQLNPAFDFEVSLNKVPRLPHYRYFEFKSNDISFSLRIDGGIAHGFKPVKFMKSEDLSFENEIFDIRKDVDYDIIYNLSIDS